MVFEWDEEKAALNLKKHGIAFDEAVLVFGDRHAVEEFDDDHSVSEDRFFRIGMSDRRLLFVVYSVRERDVIRILHARKASRKMKKLYEQIKEE